MVVQVFWQTRCPSGLPLDTTLRKHPSYGTVNRKKTAHVLSAPSPVIQHEPLSRQVVSYGDIQDQLQHLGRTGDGRRLFPAHYKEWLLGMLQPHSRWWEGALQCQCSQTFLRRPLTSLQLLELGYHLPLGLLGDYFLFGVHYWFMFIDCSMCLYAHEFMCTMCPREPQIPEIALDPLGLELKKVVSHFVGAKI